MTADLTRQQTAHERRLLELRQELADARVELEAVVRGAAIPRLGPSPDDLLNTYTRAVLYFLHESQADSWGKAGHVSPLDALREWA